VNFQGKNIAVGYENTVLEIENLDVKSGECYFLLGLNGSGKSTLLRSLAALQKPLRGQISLNNKPQSNYSIAEISQSICLVQSQSARPDYLRVYDYVAYGRMPYTGMFSTLNSKDQQKVEEAIKALGIEELKNREITSLSDGEFQKVKLAQAFCQETDILLVDEPAAHLDIGAKHELFHSLSNMAKQQNKAIIIASHEVEIALELADSIWLIHNKKLKINTAKAFIKEGLIDEIFGNEYVSFSKK